MGVWEGAADVIWRSQSLISLLGITWGSLGLWEAWEPAFKPGPQEIPMGTTGPRTSGCLPNQVPGTGNCAPNKDQSKLPKSSWPSL